LEPKVFSIRTTPEDGRDKAVGTCKASTYASNEEEEEEEEEEEDNDEDLLPVQQT
jgi:ribosomal protein L12E/L44/L45/RPP1/RPP2